MPLANVAGFTVAANPQRKGNERTVMVPLTTGQYHPEKQDTPAIVSMSMRASGSTGDFSSSVYGYNRVNIRTSLFSSSVAETTTASKRKTQTNWQSAGLSDPIGDPIGETIYPGHEPGGGAGWTLESARRPKTWGEVDCLINQPTVNRLVHRCIRFLAIGYSRCISGWGGGG